MRQLGYDQAAVMVTVDMESLNLLNTNAQFLGEGKEQIVSNYDLIFWFDKARMKVRSLSGSMHWKKTLEK